MSAATDPSIAVVIPVHNGERYIADAIESVLLQREQADIIVIDDGSTDGSAAVVSGYAPGVRYHHQNNSGAAAARNTGVRLTQGKFIAFLDADDLWMPGKLTAQLSTLGDHPTLDMVFGHAEQFVSQDAMPSGATYEPAERAVPGYLPSAMLIRRDSFDKAGPFSSEFGVGEFIDWYSRATDAGLTSLMLADLVLRRRIHTTNQGIAKRDRYGADYLRILKQTLDRRRRPTE